jgi:SAM-dependent methyltransferase
MTSPSIARHSSQVQASAKAAAFDELFRRSASSTVLREIWRTVFAQEYPEHASPFSFVTRTELTALAQAFGVAPSARLVDLGCGCGGPGLCLATDCGAALDGVDISAVAVELATAAALQRNMGDRARFHVADAASTGLSTASYTGAVSIDALQLMPAPATVIAEAARLLQPGGIFAFTTWCLPEPWRNRAVVPDYRPLLEAQGFAVLSYSEPRDWRERQLGVYRLTRERRSELEAEVGASVAALLVAEAEAAPDAVAKSSRVISVAHLPAARTDRIANAR